MKTSILIFVFCVVLHFVTPGWFFSDYLRIADWILLGCTMANFFLYKYTIDKKFGKVMQLVAAFNVLIYFLTTTRVSPQDAGGVAVFARLGTIFSIHISSLQAGEVVEKFNIFQVAIGIILTIGLAISASRKN